MVSKFENPKPGAESPFSQQCERFLDNLGRSSTCCSLLACGVYHGLPPWFSMHFKSIATFLAKSTTEKFFRSTKGGICGVRTQRRPHHHHTGHPVETSGCGRATFGFRRAPATARTPWCILANKGFTNLAIVTKFSPLPEPCDNGKTTTCGSVYRAESVNGSSTGAGARKLFERIVQQRDMQRPIPCRTSGTVDRPASGHSCRPTSFSTISFQVFFAG